MKSFGEPIAPDFDNAFRVAPVHSERSSFQKIDVYDHAHFGRMLTLDDLVQTTERDEFCYHEMLVHPALAARELVERVLVIGGGDGGTLRHVLMHGVRDAVMCEIDKAVVRVSRDHMPALSRGAFDDPRTDLVFDDGAAYVERHEGAFGAIIVDSTDPVGAAAVLVSERFYAACRRAMTPDGILVAQTGSPMYQGDELRTAFDNMSSAFGAAEVYLGFVPAYPGVLWSFTCATGGEPLSRTSPADIAERMNARGIETRFYTSEVHTASFALPEFVRSIVATTSPASIPRG